MVHLSWQIICSLCETCMQLWLWLLFKFIQIINRVRHSWPFIHFFFLKFAPSFYRLLCTHHRCEWTRSEQLELPGCGWLVVAETASRLLTVGHFAWNDTLPPTSYFGSQWHHCSLCDARSWWTTVTSQLHTTDERAAEPGVHCCWGFVSNLTFWAVGWAKWANLCAARPQPL